MADKAIFNPSLYGCCNAFNIQAQGYIFQAQFRAYFRNITSEKASGKLVTAEPLLGSDLTHLRCPEPVRMRGNRTASGGDGLGGRRAAGLVAAGRQERRAARTGEREGEREERQIAEQARRKPT